MSYRLLIVADVYPVDASIRQFIGHYPHWRSLSYSQLSERFALQHYGFTNLSLDVIQALGVDVRSVVGRFAPLQATWAREHGLPFVTEGDALDVIVAQVVAFQPDVLYVVDPWFWPPGFRQRLREACDTSPLLLLWKGSRTDYAGFGDVDLVLSCAPNLVAGFRRVGVPAEYLPFGFAPGLLDLVEPDDCARDLPLIFCGHVTGPASTHVGRYRLLAQLMADTPLHHWGEIDDQLPSGGRAGAPSLLGRARRRLRREARRARLPASCDAALHLLAPLNPLERRHPARCHRPLAGLEYHRLLARSQICLNSHGAHAGDYAGNLRMYEATGMAACLLTDWKSNLPDLFVPDVEVVAYRGVEDGVEKARYLLEHADTRRAIARAGHQRVLRDHTMERRVAHLDALIRRCLTSRHP